MATRNQDIVSSRKKEAYVRDHLAGYRTDLAIRRTFLSYLRTALTFFGGGWAMLKFSGHPIITLVGWILIPAGIIILVKGFIVNVKMNRDVQSEKHKTEEAELTNI